MKCDAIEACGLKLDSCDTVPHGNTIARHLSVKKLMRIQIVNWY